MSQASHTSNISLIRAIRNMHLINLTYKIAFHLNRCHCSYLEGPKTRAKWRKDWTKCFSISVTRGRFIAHQVKRLLQKNRSSARATRLMDLPWKWVFLGCSQTAIRLHFIPSRWSIWPPRGGKMEQNGGLTTSKRYQFLLLSSQSGRSRLAQGHLQQSRYMSVVPTCTL